VATSASEDETIGPEDKRPVARVAATAPIRR